MKSRVHHLRPSEALFSEVQKRVLALLFANPERSFYTSEILKNVKSGTGAVQRELSRLRASGLVAVERLGKRTHYRVNQTSPAYPDLQRLILKTAGLADPLADALKPHASNIKAAFVFGSMAKGTHHSKSDVDLMVVGDNLDYADLYVCLQRVERTLHRAIKPLFLTPSDWRHRYSEKDSFVHKISEQPLIPVIGSELELRR